MKVLVFLDVAADVRIPPERDPRSGRVREDWLVREVDPAGARALDLALALTADRPNGQVTVIHLGPAEHDGLPCARRSPAAATGPSGCGTRRPARPGRPAKPPSWPPPLRRRGSTWSSPGLRASSAPAGNSVCCSRRISGVPCVDTRSGRRRSPPTLTGCTATRDLDRGFRETVEVALPRRRHGGRGRSRREPRRPRRSPPGRCWPPANGTSRCGPWPTWASSPAPSGAPTSPSSTARRRPPSAASIPSPRPIRRLPAFDRILDARAGLGQAAARAAWSAAPAGEVVEEVFEVLRDEGWLDHLRPAPVDRRSGRLPVIPLEYRLREPVRLEPRDDGTWRVICESPLTRAHGERGRRPTAQRDPLRRHRRRPRRRSGPVRGAGLHSLRALPEPRHLGCAASVAARARPGRAPSLATPPRRSP